MKLLIGVENSSYDSTYVDDYILMARFPAIEDGILKEIRVYSTTSGGVKAGAYSNFAGNPSAQLTVNNSGTSVSALQWNSIIVPDLKITGSTYYWLGAISGNDYNLCGQSTGGTMKIKPGSYSTGLPSPAGTGYADDTDVMRIIGYGITSSGAGVLLGGGF
jgi:hypothetical protein